LALSREEQAVVRVFIDEYCKEEKRQNSKLGKKGSKRRK